MKYKKKYKKLVEQVRIFLRLTHNMSDTENVTEIVKVYKLIKTEDYFKNMEKHIKF